MRALLVSPVARPGGAERALVALAAALPARGVDVTAVLLEDGPLRAALEGVGCPVTIIDGCRARDLLGVRRVARRIGDLITEQRADVVLSNHPSGHVFGGGAARRAGRPAILWQHGLASRRALDLGAGLVRSRSIVCASDAAVAAQRRVTPWRRVTKIPIGIDLEDVRAGRDAASVRAEIGWRDEPIVGIVARLQPWKGHEGFLRAARQVSDARPDVRFVVVGGAILGTEGDYPERLVALADELRLADRVRFLGHREDVYDWIAALDVLAVASTVEPFGLVVLEAMALGTPVVATDAGGPAEIIANATSGLLVPPGDPGALATALLRVLDDGALAAAIADAASRRVEHFSVGRMADDIAALMREVAA